MRWVLAFLLSSTVAFAQEGPAPVMDPLEAKARQLAQVVVPAMNQPLAMPENLPVLPVNGMIELIVEAEQPFILRGYIEVIFETGSGDVLASLYGLSPVEGNIGGWLGETLEMTGYPVSGPDDEITVYFEGEGRYGTIGNVARVELQAQGSIRGSGPIVMTGPMTGSLSLGRKKSDIRGSFLSVQMQ